MYKLAIEGFRRFFTPRQQKTDTNKDGAGRGTLERFSSSCFAEWDDNAIPLTENLIDNVLVPDTCLEQFVKHLESWFGNTVYPLANDIAIRRKVMRYLQRYYDVKGTKRGYECLFNIIETDVVITENFFDFSFDSPVTFDDPFRRFDMSKCLPCSGYELSLTARVGVPITNDYLIGLYSVIKFNHIIGAWLQSNIVTNASVNQSIEAEMLDRYALSFGLPSDITDVDGYYLFTPTGNIIPSDKVNGNLRVIDGVLYLNLSTPTLF